MEAAALSQTAGLVLRLLVPPLSKKIISIRKNEEAIKLQAETIEYIGDVLSDVEGKEFKEESVNTAYRRLREAFLDAEDFLDRVHALKKKKDFETMMMKKAREEIISKNGKGKRSLAFVRIKIKPYKNKARRFFSSSNQAKYALEMHKVITNIRKNLDNISQDLRKFGLDEPSSISKAAHISARATGSNASTGIIGRDEDMRITVDLLLRSSVDRNKIPVVSIVGIGGIGKTTLAQLVYKSMEHSCKFDMHMWVSDSKNFDFKSLLKHILQSICPNDTGLEQLEEDHLRQRLVQRIHGKRFLLVLDDVDNEDQFNWENFEALLNGGDKEGSRILVTTRSRKVVSVTGSSNSAHALGGLVEKEALQLFETYAFRERMAEDLVEIGKQIVQKCHGVPLAVKVIGSYLNDKDKRKWEFVRDHSFADITDEGKQVLSVLKISYDDLDPTLKPCFSLCALFPKNYRISKELLSTIWRANVRFKTENGETLKDVCDKNMRILYNRCFLETSLRKNHNTRYLFSFGRDRETLYEWDDFDYVKMHDLMHDLARKVAGAEILVVDSNAKVESGRLIAAKEESVRHLFLTYRAPALQPEGTRLRTFLHSYGWSQTKYGICKDDKIVSACPNLRLLKISRMGIESLTKSIGKLIQLQYLDLSNNEFQTLPDSITELINLRHLDLSGCNALTHLPSGIGALASLQVLNMSCCGTLKELPRGIEKLVKLRKLLVGCCGLTHLPCKLVALTSLEVLDMHGCNNLEELPREIENLVNLRHLGLSGCKALTHLPSRMGGLVSLEKLDISHCLKLKELPRCIEKLVHLRSLKLVECCTLIHLPSGLGALRSLKVLDMSECDKLEDLPREIENLVHLRRLGLSGCKALTHLPSGLGALTSLEVLDITNCEKLKELPRGIEKLIKLKKLSLYGWDALAEMPSGMGAFCHDFTWDEDEESNIRSINALKGLKYLSLEGLSHTGSLLEGLHIATSLQVLHINNCKNLLIPEWVHKSFECEMGNRSGEFRWVKKETEGCSPTSSCSCSFFK